MGRFLAALAIAAVCAGGGSAHADDLKSYTLRLGDQSVGLNAGDTAEITLPDGSRVPVTLELNPFATYSGGGFSFNHPTTLTVARSDIDSGVVQHLLVSASGTMIIVQTFASIDPSPLDSTMMMGLTAETMQAGGSKTEGPVERTLASGQVLKGLKATVTLGDDIADYEVLGFGVGRSGIMAITRIDAENVATEGSILAQFWETLALK